MTDDDVIKAVTSKLTGELYVGQRVRVTNTFLNCYGMHGTVKDLPLDRALVPVLMDEDKDDDRQLNYRYFYAGSIEPSL